jgi:hypothetical protein
MQNAKFSIGQIVQLTTWKKGEKIIERLEIRAMRFNGIWLYDSDNVDQPHYGRICTSEYELTAI